MKNTLFVLPAILLMSAIPFSRNANPASEQKPNTLSPEEKKEGWSLLFDGSTTSGWHTYGKTTVLAQWEAKDGTIHLNKGAGKDQGGDLLTNQEYSDFDLKLEWKISPKGNSGVIFYVHEDAAKYEEPYHTGMEMQVLDNDGHSDGKIHKHRAGDLYDLIASSKETVRPVGQWNEVEIQSKNGQLKLFLNGTNVVTTTLWDANWKTMVAGSKFKQWPDFGTFRNGKIDLQDHGNEVWYRNIKIRKL
ncbi:3-keto-disaccharide hydrolase [Flavitalea flava]